MGDCASPTMQSSSQLSLPSSLVGCVLMLLTSIPHSLRLRGQTTRRCPLCYTPFHAAASAIHCHMGRYHSIADLDRREVVANSLSQDSALVLRARSRTLQLIEALAEASSREAMLQSASAYSRQNINNLPTWVRCQGGDVDMQNADLA